MTKSHSDVSSPTAQNLSAQELAEACAAAMWAEDHASKWLGMTLLHVRPGFAALKMTVRSEGCNGHGIGHGGLTFSLADSCFAFACNSYNERHVGQHTMASYLLPVRLGDELHAEAKEVSRAGRTAIYDVAVRNQNGDVCMEMRGISRRIEGIWIE